MFSRLLADWLRKVWSPWRRDPAQKAAGRLERAVACCAAGRFAEAAVLCEEALSLAPACPDASYLLGIIACHGDAPEAGARYIERALELAPSHPHYLAALGDAVLLQQRPDEAVALYARAFPGHSAALAGLTVEGQPWTRAHPDWMRTLLHVTLPLAHAGLAAAGDRCLLPDEKVESGHLLNWGLALVSRRRVREGVYLLQQALARNPGLGYGHAALALLYTLNRDWRPALAAALEARSLGVEVFRDATDLCLLAAQLGSGCPVPALHPIFDWSALASRPAAAEWQVDELPPVAGLPLPSFPEHATVYFVPSDPKYFFEYGVALACSIHESVAAGALHFHLYNPTPELWVRWEELRARLGPLVLTATWERVDYDAFGGIGPYCIMSRFARLYQVLVAARPGTRVVMLDADSLVRGDPGAVLATGREIGLAHAANEPFWHQYLGGFATFRATPAARQFLMRLARFLAANLAAGKSRPYMDQIAMYVCVHGRDQETTAAVDDLPIAVFCDTLFEEHALIWSVTQRKSADSAFDQARRSLLARYGWLEGPSAVPRSPAGSGVIPAPPG
jgi:tetratricopeptide (TPR) repeat protein